MKLAPSTAFLAAVLSAHRSGERPVRRAMRRAWLWVRRHPAAIDLGVPVAGLLSVGLILAGFCWLGCLALAWSVGVAIGCALEITRR